MKRIKLTWGKFAIVDDRDFEHIKTYKWHTGLGRNGYSRAETIIKRKVVRMHSLIVGKKEGYEVDHINGDALDNRRCNLRFCKHRGNVLNKAVRIDSKI